MVVFNDIKFQIVSASGDISFKEHQKGKDTFVEVEPDVEYYLSVQNLNRATKKHLCCRFKVDGKRLGYYIALRKSRTSVSLCGIHTRSDGVSFHNALRFVKTSVATEGSDEISVLSGMGKIELEVFEAIRGDRKKHLDTGKVPKTFCRKACSTVDPPISMKKAFAFKNKNVRSIEGHHRLMAKQSETSYRKGSHLYTITLYYCTTPGLIDVGLLPKPPCWGCASTTTPDALDHKGNKTLETVSVDSVKHNRKCNEVFELADCDQDIDMESENGLGHEMIVLADSIREAKAQNAGLVEEVEELRAKLLQREKELDASNLRNKTLLEVAGQELEAVTIQNERLRNELNDIKSTEMDLTKL